MSERFWTDEEVNRILGKGEGAELSRKLNGGTVAPMSGEMWPCGCMGFRLGENEWEITSCGREEHEVAL